MPKKPRAPNFYIRPEHLDELRGDGDWRLRDIPAAKTKQIRPFMAGDDVIAVMANGTLAPADDGVVAGFEVIRLESNPRPKEPPLNIYHYEIGAAVTVSDQKMHPAWGPDMTGGPGVEHWEDFTALDVYYDRLDDEEDG